MDAFSVITGSEAGIALGRYVHVATGTYLFGGGA
jgi:hypothetical protein